MPPLTGQPMTPLERHRRRWAAGCGNDICARARHRCFVRGSVPCQVLFIGQGPGASENAFGVPFCGVAGQLLQESVIDVAVPAGVTYALGNLIACLPTDDSGRKRQGEEEAPYVDEIKQCAPRLQELVAVCAPRLLVAVGALARDWLDRKSFQHVDVGQGGDLPVVDIVHPAAVLRARAADKVDMLRRAAVLLRQAIREHLGA